MNEGEVTLSAKSKGTEEVAKDFDRVADVIERIDKLLDALRRRSIDIESTGLDEIRTDLDELRKSIAAVSSTGIQINTDTSEAEIKQLREAVKQFESALEKLDDEAIDLTPNTEKALAELRRLEREYADRLRSIRRLGKRVDPFGVLGEAAQSEAAQVSKAFAQAEKRFERAVAAMNRASRRTDFKPASRSAKNLAENARVAALELIDLGNAARPAAAKVEGGLERIDRAADRARRSVRQLETAIKSSGNAAPAVRSLTSSMSELVSVTRAFIGLEIAQRLGDFARGAIGVSRELELARLRLENVVGGAEEAEAEFELLRDVSDRWGLSLKVLIKEFVQFTTILQSEGFTLEETRGLFEAFSAAARGAGISQDDLAGALRGLLQVAGKGVAQMEELRQQIGERFPDALNVLADGLGISKTRLFEMSEAGELLAGRTIPRLISGLINKFGPAAVKAAEGSDAAFVKLENRFLAIQRLVGDRLAPELIEALDKIFDAIENNGDALSAFLRVAETGLDGLVIALKLVDGILSGDLEKTLGAINAASFKALEIIERVIRQIVKSLGGLVETFAEIAGSIPGIGDALKASLDVAAKALRRYERLLDNSVETLEDMGEKALIFGEKSKKSGETAAEALKRIQAEARATAERMAALAEANEKAAKKSRKAWLGVAEALSGIFDQDTPSGPQAPRSETPRDRGLDEQSRQVEDLTKKLAALRAEKAKLEAQDFTSAEDQNRLAALPGKIFDAEKAVKALGEVADGLDFNVAERFEAEMDRLDAVAIERGKKVAELLAKFIGGEDFEKSFSALSEAGQSAVRDILSRIKDLAAGGIDEISSLQFEIENLVAAFEAGGQAPAGLAEIIRSAMGGSGDAVDTLRDKIDRLGESQGRAAEAAANGAQAAAEGSKAVSDGGKAAADAGSGWIELTEKIDGAEKKTKVFVGTADQATQQITRAGEAAGESTQVIADLGESSSEASGGIIILEDRVKALADGTAKTQEEIDKVKKSVFELGDGAKGASESVQAMADAAVEAGAEIERVVPAAEKSAEANREAADANREAADESNRLAAESGKAADELARTGEEAEGSTAGVRDAGEVAQKAGEQMLELGEGATSVVTPLGLIKNIASEAADALERLVIGQELNPLEALADAAAKLGEQSPVIQQTSAGLSVVAKSLGGMAESLPGVEQGLAATVDKMAEANEAGTVEKQAVDYGTLSEKLKGAATDLETIVGALDSYASGSSDVETATSTIRDAITRLSEREVVEGLRKLADELDRVSTSVQDGAAGFDDLGKAAGDFVSSADALIEGVRRVIDVFETDLAPTLDEAIAKLREQDELLSKGPERWAAWGNAGVAEVARVGEALSRISGLLDEVNRKLDEANKERDNLVN